MWGTMVQVLVSCLFIAAISCYFWRHLSQKWLINWYSYLKLCCLYNLPGILLLRFHMKNALFQIPCTVSRIWCPQLTLYAVWKRVEAKLVFLHFKDGHFDRGNFNCGPSMPSSPGETLCAAVSASAWVEPHGKCTVAFALAWSSPKIKFLKGSSYHRCIWLTFHLFMFFMFLIILLWNCFKILYPCVQCFDVSLILSTWLESSFWDFKF